MNPNNKPKPEPHDLTRAIAQTVFCHTGKWPWEAGSISEKEITELIERALPDIAEASKPATDIRLKPKKLTVVFVDSWDADLAMQVHNKTLPFKKRIAQVQLTQDQLREIMCKPVGMDGNRVVYESLAESWVEEGNV